MANRIEHRATKGITGMTEPATAKKQTRKRRPPRVKGLKTNATQRTLKWLRDRGWTADVTEKYVSTVAGEGQKKRFGGGYRKDLFGFCDVLAYRVEAPVCGGPTMIAIQCTSRQQITPHLRAYRDVEAYVKRYTGEKAKAKARVEHTALVERILNWLASPYRAFVVHGWEPVSVPKKNGDGMKVQWELTTHVVTAEDFVDEKF
jgi:hypothetical protein